MTEGDPLLHLLHTEQCFEAVLSRRADEPFDDDREHLLAAELHFTLQSLYVQALSSLRTQVVGCGRSPPHKEKSPAAAASPECTPGETAARVAAIKEMQRSHAATCVARLELTSPPPRVLSVAAAYALSEKEAVALTLLVLQRSHRTALFSGCLGSDSFEADQALLPALLCDASSLELAAFYDEERPHIKEGIIHVDEDYSSRQTASLSFEACDAIVNGLRAEARPDSYRRPYLVPGSSGVEGEAAAARTRAEAKRVKLDRLRLKLSGTKLLMALDSLEGAPPAEPQPLPGGTAASEQHGAAAVAAAAAAAAAAAVATEAEAKAEAAAEAEAAEAAVAGDQAVEEERADPDADADLAAVLARAAAGSRTFAAAEAEAVADGAAAAVAAAGDELRGYDSELEYLDDQFATLVQRIQVAAEVQKRRVKQAEVDDTPAPWEGKSKKVNLAELQAKLRISEARISARLACAGKLGVPRLEALCASLQLDGFEKSVLLITCGYTISPVVKQLLAQTSGSHAYDSDRLSVGRILQVFTMSFHEQVSKRVYFYKSARLVKKGLIRLNNDRYQSRDDLTDMLVKLDRRVLDCLVGLEDESTEVAESASLYSPSVELGDVVLPEAVRTKLLRMLTSHGQLKAYNKRVGLSKDIPQPDGLVLLLCGPSGSGKTMTANAVARQMGKKVLLVNFPVLAQSTRTAASTAQSIFREAELQGAVVFFDECESLFAKRSHGGSSEMTELLTEIERFDGVCFLATNRPQDLDEAMFRRIRCVFELPAPNHVQRLQIWRRLTRAEGIALADGVELAEIAAKFEMTGGYIRNAVLAALLAAISREPRHPAITQDDLITGCREQMRGALLGADLDAGHGRLVPSRSLDDLVVKPPLLGALRSLVALERARLVIAGGLWGDDESGGGERSVHTPRGGTTALFWGPPGCGKRAAAEALAFELGRPVKLVHLAQLLSGEARRGAKANDGVASLFREARLADAVLVITGVDGEGGGLQGGSAEPKLLELLLHETARYPGVVLLCCSSYDKYDAVVHALAPTLLAAMRAVVQFELPDEATRGRLWRMLLPPACAGLVDFDLLAKESHGFNVARIANAIYHAVAAAVLSDPDAATAAGKPLDLGMKRLQRAIQAEQEKGRGTRDALQRAMLC